MKMPYCSACYAPRDPDDRGACVVCGEPSGVGRDVAQREATDGRHGAHDDGPGAGEDDDAAPGSPQQIIQRLLESLDPRGA